MNTNNQTIVNTNEQVILNANITTNEALRFSKRETQIINLVIEGFTSREIAEILFLSENTIESHRRNMLKKARAKNMVALVRIIMKAGWLN